ncbi:MAG: ATP-dependent sacrificial sulfur transferase LarE [Candidatus Sericytochromatia bacterium]|nr:ATP-dependent sacrificial sulfur transferase LarE [Candidatus Sericytochromatia bacterium]
MREPAELVARLSRRCAVWPSALVALSGGVDSAVVLAIAASVLPARVHAVTSHAPSVAPAEVAAARSVAERLGVTHHLVDPGEMNNPAYVANDRRRCFHCKDALYGSLRRLADELGVSVVANGVHADDPGDDRPGLEAAALHGVASPLLDEGLTKDEVRAVARHLGLPVWNRPADACLASRLPHGTSVTLERLDRVGQAEAALAALGLSGHRVRDHDALARIEVLAEAFGWVLDHREAIHAAVVAAGYRDVTLDLAGYRPMGTQAETRPS